MNVTRRWFITIIVLLLVLALLLATTRVSANPNEGPVPNAPTNLQVTNTTSDSVSFSWVDNSSIEESYEVWYQVDGQAWDHTNEAPNTTTVTLNGQQCGVMHNYVVRAVNIEDGNVYFSESNMVSATPTCPEYDQFVFLPLIVRDSGVPQNPNVPAAPTSFIVTDTGQTTISVAWQDNSGNEDQFEIRFCWNQGCDTAYESANITQYTLTLTCGTEYSMYVFAVNYEGNERYESAPSNTVTASTLMCGQ